MYLFRRSSTITMKTSTFVAVALLSLVAGAKALEEASLKQIIPDYLVPGQCPTVDEKALWKTQAPHLEKFSGKWYEFSRTSNPYQLVKKCTHSNLTFNGNGFDHKTIGLNAAGGFLQREGFTQPFTTGPNAESPHLSIFWDMPIATAPFVILDTDYDSYACIYSCMDYNNNFLSDFGFIWSREPEMPAAKYLQCKTEFAKHGVNTERFQVVQQGYECNYALMESRLRSHMLQATAAKMEL